MSYCFCFAEAFCWLRALLKSILSSNFRETQHLHRNEAYWIMMCMFVACRLIVLSFDSLEFMHPASHPFLTSSFTPTTNIHLLLMDIGRLDGTDFSLCLVEPNTLARSHPYQLKCKACQVSGPNMGKRLHFLIAAHFKERVTCLACSSVLKAESIYSQN